MINDQILSSFSASGISKNALALHRSKISRKLQPFHARQLQPGTGPAQNLDLKMLETHGFSGRRQPFIPEMIYPASVSYSSLSGMASPYFH